MVANSRVVAVVEDDPSMQTSIVRLLHAHGINSEAYASAEAFLEGFSASQANCLLIDVHLGHISGLDLQRRLVMSGSRLPVIFMTAIKNESNMKAAIEAGCIAYLQKPFAAQLLIEAIEGLAN
jgi:FixJ family two-component response regulator